MKITIREAAALTARSPRTLRSWLARGLLRGEKRGNQWVLDPADLPLTAEQRRSVSRRASDLRRAAEEAIPARLGRKPRSVVDLDAFVMGREVLLALEEDGPGRRLVLSGLLHLAEAAHEYDYEARAVVLRRARAHFSRAAGQLRIDAGAGDEPASLLEERVLPSIGGLLRWLDTRRSRTTGASA